MTNRHRFLFRLLVALLALAVLSGCGIRRKKYETPITTDSKQPDKTLFDRAVNDIEKSRYEVARLTLQTLINTYPDSEYLAKAKLAIADAWYRQGGTTALAQAEAEYKDFITFFPTMAEAGEAQLKVAMIHYQQMEKANRDATHARRAEDEFKQLLLQFPNSPFIEEAKQRLREVQEVMAQHEFDVGRQYFVKGNPRAAVTRLKDLTDQYPNYSQCDEALWMLGQSFEKGGKDFRPKAAEAYGKIISDYPLSDRAGAAKEKLTEWEMRIPEAKPEAEARMRYDLEHQERRGLFSRALGVFSKRPDVSMASKAGEPVLLPGGRPGEAGMTDVRAAPADAAGGTGIRLEAVPLSTETPAGATPVQPGQQPAAQPATQPPPATPQPQPPATQPPAQPQKPDAAGGPTEQAAVAPPANTTAAAAAPSTDKPTDQPQPNAKKAKKKEKKKKGK
jgi:outer membrane protein assembly factor BamD